LFEPRFDSLQPVGIAYCNTAADVATCLSFVTKFQLPVRVRSGGHSYAGWSSVNGGVIIDVSPMNSVSFTGDTVTVGAGIDLIRFYAPLAASGVAVPGGSRPTIGIAGLTLGGGIGSLTRLLGTTSDNMTATELVAADGTELTCDDTQNTDLFWACRGGGGGNFGITTSLTFRTRPLSTLCVFVLSWPWSQAARVIKAWQSWAPHAPDNLWSTVRLSANFGVSQPPHQRTTSPTTTSPTTTSPTPTSPTPTSPIPTSPPTGGPTITAPTLTVMGTYAGPLHGAARHLDAFYAQVGTGPAVSSLRRETFLNAMLLEADCAGIPLYACRAGPSGHPPRVPSFAKSDFFTRPLRAHAIRLLLSGIEEVGSIQGAAGGVGTITLAACGGAMNKPSLAATAFVHRDALFLAQYSTTWASPGAHSDVVRQRGWLRAYYQSLHQHASGQAYQNYVDPDLVDWPDAYYGTNYPWLTLVKTRVDPTNVFQFPQSIVPG
ncbi:MAG TPA: FAD-dependent oxidoreductase, partial [Streptosporangiaceae bacterium]|nr:FAD-dependent oxidoreductase [Streptosporangiaceae bacterium]